MALIWGSTFLAIRFGIDTVPPLWGATIRLLLATPLLFLLAIVRKARMPRGRALAGVVSFGFLNLGVNFALLYWGEQRVPSGIAAVLYATIPLSTGIFAWISGLQRLDPIRTLAALIGLGGVALIFAGEIKLGAPLAALAAVFLGATTASLSTVVLKHTPPQSPFMVNAIGAAAGIPVCLGASFLLGESHRLPVSLAGWWPILYLALAGNLGAYVLYAWLLEHWRVTSIATVTLVIPIIAVALGSLTRGEAPAAMTYIGGIVVLVGVAVSLRAGSRS